MFEHLIGRSPAFKSLIQSARQVAGIDVTVLIVGETGTGKELVARALWHNSKRSHEKFVTLNCAALPETLAESELFGHRRGSFTGAHENRVGLFEAADGGTLFLDEVDSLSLKLQAKLLRFLESGEIQTVGERSPKVVNVRIIAASNGNLSAQVQSGEFRRDLFYRLEVVPLNIPPLRDRQGDIALLVRHFIQKLSDPPGAMPIRFSDSCMAHLDAYRWPGNVRQLRNLCQRLGVMHPGKVIEVRDLPQELFEVPVQFAGFQDLFANGVVGLDQVEVKLIRQALSNAGDNRTLAARTLGISRDKLLYRMRKYGLR
jgi:DNA-binding NtrC family response regulator